ncbi:hypothetical protein BDV96DRAFT_588020 [Lophiotrema nucula]|uniref:Thioredoxin reductase n=1 Tax=Lophiotrema nucula TaxID=690887 RepID=A0A6A5YMR1_9PLEO|nr:hypothetical protein BDV96DRAFT_588020 [Lophiotrema nucula]
MLGVSPSSVASIAQALNAAQVPCVLWGHCLLNIHGVPSIVSSIDFVVPDDRLQVSIETLSKVRTLPACLRGELCPSGPQPYSPAPAFHIHMDGSKVTVDLYLQSETLWFLPSFDGTLSSPRKAKVPFDLVIASDQTILPPRRPGRGSGVFPSTEYPVLVPRAHVLLEAFMRLYVRDAETRTGSFAMAMITYMEEYVDEDGLLDVDRLPEPLGSFYKELGKGKKPVRQWTEELKGALRREDDRGGFEKDQ